MKKRVLLTFIAIIILLSMVSCVADRSPIPSETEASETEKSTSKPTAKPTARPTKKPTEAPTAVPDYNSDVVIEGEEKEMQDVTSYNLEKFLYPIWKEDISYAEAAFVRENEDGDVEPIELLYPIEKIISVRSSDLRTEYVCGIDYDVDEEGRLIVLESGRIPVLEYGKYFFKLTNAEHQANKLKTKFPAHNNPGYGYIRAEVSSSSRGMGQWTLAVTYKHSAESVVSVPESKSEVFAPLIEKLSAGEKIKIVSTGDSITDGWSSTGKVGIQPFCPQYNYLVEKYIKEAYDVETEHRNVGVSGSNSNGGVSKLGEICAEDPDLVIIAFGMNDGGGIPVADYVNNINTMVNTVKEECPDACVIVVGTALPNDKVCWNPGSYNSLLVYHKEYAPALEEAEKEWTNAAFANVTKINEEMYSRKVYQDLSGSNSNHPNDYMHRIYAQVILQTMFGYCPAEQ